MAAAILNYLGAYWDAQDNQLVVFMCTTFWSRCSSIDNMKLLIYARLA